MTLAITVSAAIDALDAAFCSQDIPCDIDALAESCADTIRDLVVVAVRRHPRFADVPLVEIELLLGDARREIAELLRNNLLDPIELTHEFTKQILDRAGTAPEQRRAA